MICTIRVLIYTPKQNIFYLKEKTNQIKRENIMATISKGGKTLKRGTSILDIEFSSNLFIYVFDGSFSQNDILIKYKDLGIPGSQIRTPKHIHWVVDLLIKKEHAPQLVNQYLTHMQARWNTINPLRNNSYSTLRRFLTSNIKTQLVTTYQPLDQHGYYPMELILYILELLAVQEKTNNSNAFMFKNVIDTLLNSNDLAKIISTTTHR